MNSVKISWHRADLTKVRCGHGLCVYSGGEENRNHLAAFVEGFRWYHRGDLAVVRFDPRYVPADEGQFAAFKTALEGRIRAGDLSQSGLIPGYGCIANA